MTEPVDLLRAGLRRALTDAMKSRNTELVSAVRSLLAAIDNAESAGIQAPPAGAIESSTFGLGAADVPRRALTTADLETVFDGELAEREAGAASLEASQSSRVAAFRSATAELAALRSALFSARR